VVELTTTTKEKRNIRGASNSYHLLKHHGRAGLSWTPLRCSRRDPVLVRKGEGIPGKQPPNHSGQKSVLALRDSLGLGE
jgi:hypothetical protein